MKIMTLKFVKLI